jgi:hypothetical protein
VNKVVFMPPPMQQQPLSIRTLISIFKECVEEEEPWIMFLFI